MTEYFLNFQGKYDLSSPAEICEKRLRSKFPESLRLEVCWRKLAEKERSNFGLTEFYLNSQKA